MVLYAQNKLNLTDDSIPSDILEQIHQCNLDKVLERTIPKFNNDRSQKDLNKIINIISQIALNCLTEERIFLKQEEDDEIEKTCIAAGMEYKDIKSIFFKVKFGILHEETDILFVHKSSQDFLAAQTIYKKIEAIRDLKINIESFFEVKPKDESKFGRIKSFLGITKEISPTVTLPVKKAPTSNYYNCLLIVLNLLSKKDNYKIQIQLQILKYLIKMKRGKLNMYKADRLLYNCSYKNHAAELLVEHGIEDGYNKDDKVNHVHIYNKHFVSAVKLLDHNWQPERVTLYNFSNKSRPKMIEIIKMIKHKCNIRVNDNYNYSGNNKDDKSTSYDIIESINNNIK